MTILSAVVIECDWKHCARTFVGQAGDTQQTVLDAAERASWVYLFAAPDKVPGLITRGDWARSHICPDHVVPAREAAREAGIRL